MKEFSVPEPKIHPNVKVRILRRADTAFPFLHDTMLYPGPEQDFLTAAWYASSTGEICGRTVIMGKESVDGGAHWSEDRILCEDSAAVLHMVPVTFVSDEKTLYAYVTEMTSHDCPTGYRCLKRNGKTWETVCRSPVPVLFNTIPIQIGSRLLFGCRMASAPGGKPIIPAAAWAEPSGDGTPFHFTFTPLPVEFSIQNGRIPCPETTFSVVEENGLPVRIDGFIRNDFGAHPIRVESTDGGKHWIFEESVIPARPAKMCAGSIKERDLRYLIFNSSAAPGRSQLILAAGPYQERIFDRAWILADGRYSSADAGPDWHYPCACVQKDTLLISCTASSDSLSRHAALLRVPINTL